MNRPYKVACRKCGSVSARSSWRTFICIYCQKSKYAIRGWAKIRARALEESPCCERCSTTTNLHVDHIDKDRSNNKKENLRTLCAQCHMSRHRNEDKTFVRIEKGLLGSRSIYI